MTMATQHDTPTEILTGRHTVADYPYGRLQCEMTFWIEYKPKKGYRMMRQSVNPKTGRLNKPKASTYSPFAYMYRDEKGHVQQGANMLCGYEEIEAFGQFLVNHPTLEISPEESKRLWVVVIQSIRGNAQYTRRAEGTDDAFKKSLRIEKMLALYRSDAPIFELSTTGFSAEEIRKACGFEE